MRHLLIACVSGAVLALAGTVFGSDPGGVTNLAGKTELPAGKGLAAQFPGDAGLKTHADVIFADDFETGALGAGWDETRNQDGKVLQFAALGDAPGLGQRCLRVEAHLGKDTGGGLTKWFEPADPVFIRFYTRFDPGCDYVNRKLYHRPLDNEPGERRLLRQCRCCAPLHRPGRAEVINGGFI
jgi:hypothetical protein